MKRIYQKGDLSGFSDGGTEAKLVVDHVHTRIGRSGAMGRYIRRRIHSIIDRFNHGATHVVIKTSNFGTTSSQYGGTVTGADLSGTAYKCESVQSAAGH